MKLSSLHLPSELILFTARYSGLPFLLIHMKFPRKLFQIYPNKTAWGLDNLSLGAQLETPHIRPPGIFYQQPL